MSMFFMTDNDEYNVPKSEAKPQKGLLEGVLSGAKAGGKQPTMGDLFAALVLDLRQLTLDTHDLKEAIRHLRDAPKTYVAPEKYGDARQASFDDRSLGAGLLGYAGSED